MSKKILLALILGLLPIAPAFSQQVLTYGPKGAVAVSPTGNLQLNLATNPPTINGGFAPNSKAASFSASVGNLYFVTVSSTATLPTAVGNKGLEVSFVNDAASGVTITYATVSSQTVNGTTPGTNATAWLRDNFISDGTGWIKK